MTHNPAHARVTHSHDPCIDWAITSSDLWPDFHSQRDAVGCVVWIPPCIRNSANPNKGLASQAPGRKMGTNLTGRFFRWLLGVTHSSQVMNHDHMQPHRGSQVSPSIHVEIDAEFWLRFLKPRCRMILTTIFTSSTA